MNVIDIKIKKPSFVSKVIRRQRLPIRAVVVSGKGDPILSFDKKASWLIDRLSEKSIRPAGPIFGMYYTDRREAGVKNVKWEACVPVAPETVLGDDLKIKEFPETEVVSTTLTGGYDLIGPALEYLEAAVEASGLKTSWPLTEVYLNEGKTPVTELQYLLKNNSQ